MQFASRFALAVVPALVIWGGYKAYERDEAETVRTRLLPPIEKALSAEIEASADAVVCVAAPLFPYGQDLPRTGWTTLPNGLSECRVTGSAERVPPCKDCSTLEDLGLLEKAELEMPDATGNVVRREALRLTAKGRALYYADIKTRQPWKDDACTPGQVAFVSADRRHEADAVRPGFCFADGLRLHGIPDFQKPQKTGAQAMLGIKYEVEVVNPDPVIFEQDMKMLLDKTPKRGSPALLPTETTTAIFPMDHSQPPYFDSGLSYGDWALDQIRAESR